MIRVLSAVALLAFLPVGANSQAQIQFLTHSADKYTHYDEQGVLRGNALGGRRAFLVALVNEMIEHQGQQPLNIKNMPLKRALKAMASSNNSALFNVTRTPAREHLFSWVGPIQTDTVYLYGRPGSQLKTFADAKKAKGICVFQGNTTGQKLRDMGFQNIVSAPSYESCIKMVVGKRVEFSLHGESTFKSTLKAAELSDDDMARTDLVLWESEGYLIFTKDIPEQFVKSWQKTLDDLINSGRYEEIRTSYYVQ